MKTKEKSDALHALSRHLSPQKGDLGEGGGGERGLVEGHCSRHRKKVGRSDPPGKFIILTMGREKAHRGDSQEAQDQINWQKE